MPRSLSALVPLLLAALGSAGALPAAEVACTWLTPSRPRGPSPCLVVAPGRGYHRGRPLMVALARAAQRAGFVAVTFDWSYFTAKGEPSPGLAREREDLASVVAAARRRPGVDPTRVVVAGKSLGSLVAWSVFAADPSLRALVLLTPVLPTADQVERAYPGLVAERRPTLVVLGDRDDDNCPVRELYAAAARAARPPAIHVVQGSHGLESDGHSSVDPAAHAAASWLSGALLQPVVQPAPTPAAATATPDTTADRIIEDILARKRDDERRRGPGAPVEYATFWDLDGTVVYGDITEGARAAGGRSSFQGLCERAVLAGLVDGPSGPAGFASLMKLYRNLEAQDQGKAYVWLAERCDAQPPARRAQLLELATEYCRSTLADKVFASSARILAALRAAGISVYVISASPAVFVEAFRAAVLPWIPAARATGIDRRPAPGGGVLDPLVNYGTGKVARVRAFVAARPGRVVPLAAFGNSWRSDGDFLDHVARAGGLAVMINGGPATRRIPGVLETSFDRTIGE